tara:strand:- start:423 stop:938 length:516 start_codon:yes stop_codon:yes gene_type:complete
MIVHKNPYFEIILKNNYYAYKPKNKEVIILPVVDNNKFLLVKSKRVLLKKSIYELPAGSINKNESLIHGAMRELQEETGIKLLKKNKFIKMKAIFQIPNRNPSPINAFYVKLSADQILYKNFDRREISSIKIFNLKQVLDLIKRNKLITSVPIAIILQYVIKNMNSKISYL